MLFPISLARSTPRRVEIYHARLVAFVLPLTLLRIVEHPRLKLLRRQIHHILRLHTRGEKEKKEKEELLTKSDINSFARDCNGLIINKAARVSNGKVFVYNQKHLKNEYENAIVIVNSEMMVLDIIHENPALII